MPWPPSSLPSLVVSTDTTPQRTQHAADHNALAVIANGVLATAWTYVNPSGGAAPAFNSPWANFGSGYQVLRFRKELGDVCRIEGAVGGGTTGSVVFTLPLGFRPAASIRFYSQVDSSAGNPGRMDITNTGTVTLTYLSGSGNVSYAPMFCTFVIDPASL